MRDRLVKFLATGFGVGLTPVAPGLAGSLVGLGWWWVVGERWWLIPVGFAVAVWLGTVAAKVMGHLDPPSVVVDEMCALPVALWGLEGRWEIVTGFVLFRLFDVWKPWPIRRLQSLPGGLGIVADDVLAALYACVFTHGAVLVLSRVS